MTKYPAIANMRARVQHTSILVHACSQFIPFSQAKRARSKNESVVSERYRSKDVKGA